MVTGAQLPDLSALSHALGPATDTKAHLAALAGDSAGDRAAAIEHLDIAIVPGGFATAVTGQVTRYVAALLTAGEVRDSGTKIELLYFLGQVTEAAEDDPALVGVAECRACLPTILAAAEACESDSDGDVRVEAADTAEAAIEAIDRSKPS